MKIIFGMQDLKNIMLLYVCPNCMGRKKGTTGTHAHADTNFPYWRERKIGEHTVSFFTEESKAWKDCEVHDIIQQILD